MLRSWLPLFLLWLLLTATFVPEEIAAGGLAAALASLAHARTGKRLHVRPRLPRPRARRGLELLGSIPKDLIRLVTALARRTGGAFRLVPSATGSAEESARALAILGASIAPSQYAIGIDVRGERILVHVLPARAAGGDS